MSDCSCCCCNCTTVEQYEAGIVENCGRYDRTIAPGLQRLGCFESLVARVSLRLEMLREHVQSKTKDGVFVTAHIAVQYSVVGPDAAAAAYYSLENPAVQLAQYIHNSVRALIPQYDFDDLFLVRAQIADVVQREIGANVGAFGYSIGNVVVDGFGYSDAISQAMNSIQSYQRDKQAVQQEAETAKIQVVKVAEAEAEAKRLSGVGLAQQRKAIVDGLETSVAIFQRDAPGASMKSATSLLLFNQYFDTLRDVSNASSSSTLMLRHSGGLRHVAEQMEDSFGAHRRK
jgi:regulator of protease activity HflC (stomatin/prohibitin superfamily)